MPFEPFTPVFRSHFTPNQDPEAYVSKGKKGIYIKLNAAALREMGGVSRKKTVVLQTGLYIDPKGGQVGFGDPINGAPLVTITSSSLQPALNQAAKAAGFKLVPGKVYKLEKVQLLPVEWRIREQGK